jgi:hypothetical protein
LKNLNVEALTRDLSSQPTPSTPAAYNQQVNASGDMTKKSTTIVESDDGLNDDT